MKKLVLATALVAAFSSQVMAASTSTVGNTQAGKATDGSTPGANSGIVRFKGAVVDQTCTIATESQDQLVVLENVPKNRFVTAGDTAMPTPFSIKLSNCTFPIVAGKATKVKARFASVQNVDTANNYTLKNTKTGGANGVNIQLYKADGTTALTPMKRVTKNTPHPYTNVADDNYGNLDTISGTEHILHYIAKYYATTAVANITTGEVESAVDFELTYE